MIAENEIRDANTLGLRHALSARSFVRRVLLMIDDSLISLHLASPGAKANFGTSRFNGF